MSTNELNLNYTIVCVPDVKLIFFDVLKTEEDPWKLDLLGS